MKELAGWVSVVAHPFVMVGILVAVPAGIDIPDRDGRTPLFVAAAAGHREVVELLLDNGAKPNMSRNTGESPVRATRAAPTAWRAPAARRRDEADRWVRR